MSEWIWWYFYGNFHEEQVIPPGHFVLNSEKDFAHISSPGSLTDNSMNLGSIKKGFLMVPNFP